MMWTTGCAVRSTGGLLGEGQTLEGDFEQTSLTTESVDGMKALRLRTRWDYRVRGTTLGGVSRERRRSRWNISRSTHTSTTRWLQWSGPTAIWCERNGLSMTAARCANSWNIAILDRPSRSRPSANCI